MALGPLSPSLGDDPLQPKIDRSLKEPETITVGGARPLSGWAAVEEADEAERRDQAKRRGMIAELDRRAGIRLNQLPERCPALDERGSPQIRAIEMQEIEGKEHDPMRRLVDG